MNVPGRLARLEKEGAYQLRIYKITCEVCHALDVGDGADYFKDVAYADCIAVYKRLTILDIARDGIESTRAKCEASPGGWEGLIPWLFDGERLSEENTQKGVTMHCRHAAVQFEVEESRVRQERKKASDAKWQRERDNKST